MHSQNQYIIEELNRDGSVNRILATADNGIIGRAAFVASCHYITTGKLIYRWKARVIDVRE